LTQAIEQASVSNPWFTPEFIRLSIQSICKQMLDPEKLRAWITYYHLDNNIQPKKTGIVMAGNIPLVGFHDLLSVFLCGHQALIKPSSKDTVLVKYLTAFFHQHAPETSQTIVLAEKLNEAEAIIATGNNQSAALFESYFSHLPHIIRKNRTSVAVLTGNESKAELDLLADDIHLYFGLGCRNVTKIFVPRVYDFIPLLQAFQRYDYFREHHKYRNNFDYQLSLLILNNRYYMNGGPTILLEEESLFSPISMLHYAHYDDPEKLHVQLSRHPDLQCIVGSKEVPFGSSQTPGLFDYPDGVDILQFLLEI
jgi:hypothetical protein